MAKQALRPKEDQARSAVPAWAGQGGGGNKGNDTVRNAALAGNKSSSNVLAPKGQRGKGDADRLNERPDQPAWMDALQTGAQVAAPLLAGPAGVPQAVSNLANQFMPQIAPQVAGVYSSLFPANKNRRDTFAPGSPNKNLDTLGRMSGRTMFGEGIAPGTLDPALWDQTGEGGDGFGTSYRGNWRGGGGGYGGGGYGGYENYPAWVRSLMGLNSWNIK